MRDLIGMVMECTNDFLLFGKRTLRQLIPNGRNTWLCKEVTTFMRNKVEEIMG